MMNLEDFIEKNVANNEGISVLNKIFDLTNFSKSKEYQDLFKIGEYFRTTPVSALGQERYEKEYKVYYNKLKNYVCRAFGTSFGNDEGQVRGFSPICVDDQDLGFTTSINLKNGTIWFETYMHPDKIEVKKVWGSINSISINEEALTPQRLTTLKDLVKKRYINLD